MKSILMIGASEFGKHFADKMLELNNEVRFIDKDEELIDSLSSSYENALIGDCRDIHVVEQLGIPFFDLCVVSVGGDFQASLEITSNLKELGAKHIISQCQSDSQARFLKMAGADQTVYPAREAAEKIAYLCNGEGLIDYISVSRDFKIIKVMVPKSWVGHRLPELNIRQKYQLNILAVENNSRVTVPDVSYVFQKEDLVLILGEEAQLNKIHRMK